MAEIQFNGDTWEIKDALQAFYTPYASYVIQTRALPDARDGLKKGARFILYSQYKDKLTYKEKRRKAVATINAAMRFSPHGDASILGTAVRLSQNFSLRYPVIEIQGNNGSVMYGDDYSQARYIECRGNEIAWDMTYLLDKNTIDDWRLNYTEEELYPSVLPSKFPFALVNGSYGIAVACSSSVPPHNLNDVCDAVVKLINNPDATFEELYCPIDFPTGGIIINEEAVKESLRTGNGRAALVRAKIEYDENENELIVKEIPYMTFTNSIVSSISKAIEDGVIHGISSVIDGTDFEGCKIYIKLEKNVNPSRITKLLYKHTLLQNSFSINMNMLENGKVPKLYGWKDMLETYVSFLREIIVKAYKFDLDKLLKRINILDGLILAYQNIEEVVKVIRNSKDSAEAKTILIEKFNFNNEQVDSILKLRLSSLTHLEITKLEKEKTEKEEEAAKIKDILSSDEKIKQAMINDVMDIKQKYGDERRTKVINLDFTSEDEDAEPIEKKQLLIHYTNLGNLYTQESSTLLTSRRGGKGTKIKLAPNEVITQTLADDNLGSLLVFSNKGIMYSIATDELPVNTKINVAQLFEFGIGEKITALTTISRRDQITYFVFVTKNGLIKKTLASEYDKKRGKSIRAINLRDNDEVVEVHFINDESIGILTKSGNFVVIETNSINPIGRTSQGIKAIKLSDNDYVLSSHVIKGNSMITVSKDGFIKKTNLSEFPICNRGIKGKKISGVREEDEIVEFLTLDKDCDIIIVSDKGTIKINTLELRTLSRDATGVKVMNLNDGVKIVDLVKA